MASLNSAKGQRDQVLVEENLFARTLILNRPKQLNALSSQMISRLLELFLAYEGDPNVKLIVLKGNGRAFCAGGDVSAVVRNIREGYEESSYQDTGIHFKLCDGDLPKTPGFNPKWKIVMGGGAGASMHGRFRVATENSVFAMPETALGLFPDAGASYFLSRLPGFFVGTFNSKVEQYFSKVEDEEWEDVRLPGRLNLPAYVTAKL